MFYEASLGLCKGKHMVGRNTCHCGRNGRTGAIGVEILIRIDYV